MPSPRLLACALASALALATAAPAWAAMRDEAGMGVVTSLSDAPSQADVAGPADLRSLLRPGESPAFGDLVRTARFFGDWSLLCDRLLSREGQMCWLEHRAPSSGGDVVVRFEVALDSRPVLVVGFPGESSPDFGGRLVSGPVDVLLGRLSCQGLACVSVTPMGGALESAFGGRAPIDLVYERGGRRFAARIGLRGFAEAVRSLPDSPPGATR